MPTSYLIVLGGVVLGGCVLVLIAPSVVWLLGRGRCTDVKRSGQASDQGDRDT